ncbi:MAG: hypothetical protein Kow0059_02420 [Candidatus Sumerlaeia bacterium]
MGAPSQSDTRSMTILMGVNDSFCLGPGWFAPTVDARFGIPYRPTGQTAQLIVPVPCTAGGELSVLMTSCPALLGRPIRARVALDGCMMGETTIQTDLWCVWRMAFPPMEPDPVQKTAPPHSPPHQQLYRRVLSLSVDEPFIPDVRLHNGDHRRMGLYLSALRFVWTS